MSWRITKETERLRDRAEKGDPLWPAQVALGIAIVLNLALTDKLTVGPSWLLPAIEAAGLAVLVYVAPARATRHDARRRRIALAVIGLVTLANVVSLILLVHYLIAGGRVGGHALIGSGFVLWTNNVLIFGVWFWELDGGGPVYRFLHPDGMKDFRFPQQEIANLAGTWRPGFGDYLYTSLTNATAFSPTDTMPLTLTAKAVMAVQEVAALATIGLVFARAVNILA